MLVLSRNVGESIWIGDHIHVTVVAISRNQVRMGIDAPADMPIDRQEVRMLKAARAEDKPSAGTPPARPQLTLNAGAAPKSARRPHTTSAIPPHK